MWVSGILEILAKTLHQGLSRLVCLLDRQFPENLLFGPRQKFHGGVFNFDFLAVIIKYFPKKPSSMKWLKYKLPLLTQDKRAFDVVVIRI